MNIVKILSIPKSVYINLKVFDFKTAIKLPILVSYNTKLIGINKGSFNGLAQFSKGNSIRVGANATLIIGNNFAANKECSIICDGNMKIGNDVLLGWKVNIRDADGHSVYDNITKIKNPIQKNVTIGNHVWIASYVDILKGVEIKDNSVIAYRSCVLSKFHKSNCIIGGYPAKILRENINWEK